MNTKERKIIAVDLDGTLAKEICHSDGEVLRATPVKEVVDWVNLMYRNHHIMIYTARRDFLIESTFEWLRRNNIRYHSFSNLKTPADIYLDDKAFRPEEISSLTKEMSSDNLP